MPARRNQTLAFSILLLGMLLFTQEALAAVGRIYYVSGGVYVERATGKVPAEVDTILEEGDVIVTESDGRVQWRLSDDSFFVLKPDSRFRVSAHQFPEGQAGQTDGLKASYEFLKGGFRTLTGLIASRNAPAYQTRTAVATLGVRGTDYTLIFVSAAEATSLGVQGGLYIRVDSGLVEITNSAGSIRVEAGQFGYVEGPNIIPTLLPEMPAIYINWVTEFEFLYPGLGEVIDRLPRIEPIEEPCIPAPSPNTPCP